MKSPRLLAIAALVASFTFSGCVSSKYKRSKDSTPPAVALNLTVAQPPILVAVTSVVVFHGPGSWKRDAYWDEYALSVVNHGTTPLTVDSASLVGFAGNSSTPGAEPWSLEKQSRSAASQNFGFAKDTVVQLGGGLATVVGGGIIGSLIAPAGWIVPAGLGPGLLVALPIAVGGTIYRNVSGRRDIQAEFTRRRLALPLTLAPGQSMQGSLFFPITPGPRQLSLRARATVEPFDAIVELTPLAGLHLKQPPATAGKPSSP